MSGADSNKTRSILKNPMSSSYRSSLNYSGVTTKEEKENNLTLFLTVHQILNRITQNLKFRRKCVNLNVSLGSITKSVIQQHQQRVYQKEDQIEMDKMRFILQDSVRRLSERVEWITQEMQTLKR